MEHAARRYVRWVLTIHLGLLVVVAAGLLLVAREVYERSRQQAMDEARTRHELLARQTARAIDGHYSAILADLKLLSYAKKDERVAEGLKGLWVLAPVLWSEMGQRVSHLLRIDPKTMEAFATYPEGAAAKIKATQILADPSTRDWLLGIKGPTISGYKPDGGGGYHLAAVPVSYDGSVLVAVVPFGSVQRLFLDSVNERDGIAAHFLEQNAPAPPAAMAGFPEVLLFADWIPDKPVAQLTRQYLADNRRGTEIVNVPVAGYTPGSRDGGLAADTKSEVKKPRMFTLEPLNLPGGHSAVLISSWLSNVDAVVNATFRRAALGTALVLVVVTGIIASTSVQLIRGRLRLERERHAMLRKEIDQARQIQLAWLPSADRGCDNPCSIAAANKPASHVSGDFYDWFDLDGCKVAVTIGDVTGHGMAAAFLMATTQLLVRTAIRRSGDPGACLDEVNRQLCGHGFGGQFVTMLVAVVNTDSGEVEIASAGHYPPLVSDNGTLHPLPMDGNFVLGVEPDAPFATERFALSPGASLLLYTDGVIEARDPAGEHFTAARLRRALAGDHPTAQSMIDAVIAAVETFRGPRDLQDDLTLVALQLQPAPARTKPLAAAV